MLFTGKPPLDITAFCTSKEQKGEPLGCGAPILEFSSEGGCLTTVLISFQCLYYFQFLKVKIFNCSFEWLYLGVLNCIYFAIPCFVNFPGKIAEVAKTYHSICF